MGSRRPVYTAAVDHAWVPGIARRDCLGSLHGTRIVADDDVPHKGHSRRRCPARKLDGKRDSGDRRPHYRHNPRYTDNVQ